MRIRGPSRSRIAIRKTRHYDRVPAGDHEPHDCGTFILTETGEPILSEAEVGLAPES